MHVSILHSLTRRCGFPLIISLFSLLLLGCGSGGGGGGGSGGGGSITPPPNNPPAATITANAGADRTVNAGDVVELKASGSGGTITGYSWKPTAGPSVTLTAVDFNAGWFTFVAPSTGTENSITITYRLTVTASGNATAEDSVTFTVLRVNQAPTASA